MVLTGNRSRPTVPRLLVGRHRPGRRCRPGSAATGWTALGAVLVIGIGAAFGYLYSTAGSKEPVVVMTAPVAVGEVIARSDLSTVDVAGDITAIAGGEPGIGGRGAGRRRAAAGNAVAAVDGHRRGPDPHGHGAGRGGGEGRAAPGGWAGPGGPGAGAAPCPGRSPARGIPPHQRFWSTPRWCSPPIRTRCSRGRRC